MNIRTATFNDLEQISEVEAQCFPAAEAATKEEFADRLHYYGDHFWLMFDHEKLIAFVDGFVTDEPDLYDEMYEKYKNKKTKRRPPFGERPSVMRGSMQLLASGLRRGDA